MPRQQFSQDTDLKASTSPLTADFIDDYLLDKQKGELSGIGDAVLKAAKKYGINATYIVSHAALESGWGTSKISKEKNNLFGWSAFDSSPYDSSKAFPDRATCIDFVMGRVDALYLTKGGKYYRRGPVLGSRTNPPYGMNAKYATDPDWGRKIASIGERMELAFLKTAPAVALTPGVIDLATPEDGDLATVTTMLARARSAAGKKTIYELGKGGMKPTAAHPGSHCDCSGYVSWVLGFSRMTDHPTYKSFNGGWVNTDAIVHDANVATGFFTKLDTPKRGCLIVYPSSKSTGVKIGHVGIVTEVSGGKATKVIHCSSGNSKRGDAIAETGPEVWNKPITIYAWYEGLR